MVRRGRARLFSISGSPYIILHRLLRLAILGAIARFPTVAVIQLMEDYDFDLRALKASLMGMTLVQLF